MENTVDASDRVWLERSSFDEAEAYFQQHIHQLKTCGQHSARSSDNQLFSPIKKSIASEIAKARQHISETLNSEHIPGNTSDTAKVKELYTKIQKLESTVDLLTERISDLECLCKQRGSLDVKTAVASVAVVDKKDEENDDFELFGSEDEEEVNEEADRVKQERLKAYEEKKSKKPVLIAKSNIILDVKPWDDETDMAVLEQNVRSIQMDGLLWGASKLVPLAYGIKKLQISCVVEDDKVSVDELEEKIVAFEEQIQSMDIAAFNKI